MFTLRAPALGRGADPRRAGLDLSAPRPNQSGRDPLIRNTRAHLGCPVHQAHRGAWNALIGIRSAHPGCPLVNFVLDGGIERAERQIVCPFPHLSYQRGAAR